MLAKQDFLAISMAYEQHYNFTQSITHKILHGISWLHCRVVNTVARIVLDMIVLNMLAGDCQSLLGSNTNFAIGSQK